MTRSGLSLRSYLLLGILLPVTLLVMAGAASLYRAALAAADTAYDRTLLASAKVIGEQLSVAADGGGATLEAGLPYSALEAFEADNRSRLYYRVQGFKGETVSGFDDLPPPRADSGVRHAYAALVDFYAERFRGESVRMAVLRQPVAGPEGHGMAVIQVAETLELRQALARRLLLQTLAQQAFLMAVIALVVLFVVHRAAHAVGRLSRELRQRPETVLTPLAPGDAPAEMRPFVEATNSLMGRLGQLLEHQKRFVRDASHQLRTPLAVLQAQVQSARRGDVDAATALAEIDQTVKRATELANQMLALAKVEQLRHQGPPPVLDWSPLVRSVALDVSALATESRLDFEVDTQPAWVRGHEWALKERTRNLLHNGIRHCPPRGSLRVRLRSANGRVELCVCNSGLGIADDVRQRLFQPFSAGSGGASGLGLAICREIVDSLGGSIHLDNRVDAGQVVGVDARVLLDSAPATPPQPAAPGEQARTDQSH